MEHFEVLGDMTPVTTGKWHSLKELAGALTEVRI
jgi:hypothetical protein